MDMFKTVVSDDSDSDSISLTSTYASDTKADEEYPIKELVADKWSDARNGQVYLVHWEGYPIEKATWEPAESFVGSKINIVHEYKRQKRLGNIPYFDFEEWDAQRDKEASEKLERQRRREEKRSKLDFLNRLPTPKRRKQADTPALVKDTGRRAGRKPSPELAGFVVRDDCELDDEDLSDVLQPPTLLVESEEDDDDIPIMKRNLRRKKKQPPDIPMLGRDQDSESSSGNSFIMPISPRSRAKGKGKARSGQEERLLKRPLQRAVPKKRPLSKSQSQSVSPPRSRKRPNAGARVKMPTVKQTPATATGLTARKAPRLYDKLSVLHAVQKRSNIERAPRAEELNLIKLGGNEGAVIDIKKSLSNSRRPHTSTISDIQQPKRKRSPPPTILDPGIGTMEKSSLLEQPPLKRPATQGVVGFDTANDTHSTGFYPMDPSQFPPPAHVQRVPQFQSGPERKFAPSMRSESMDMDPQVVDTYECEVSYGPSLSTMQTLGRVRFMGFGSEFMAMLQGLALETLWVSKSLEIGYIQKKYVPVSKHYRQLVIPARAVVNVYVVPLGYLQNDGSVYDENSGNVIVYFMNPNICTNTRNSTRYGMPIEYVDLVPSDDVDASRFTTTLSVFHGAGVIIHKEFTLIIFQPSNDQLRNAFKTPQQKHKSPLRAVLYPPLDVHTSVPPQNVAPIHQPFDPWFDSYLPNLLCRTTGSYSNILKTKLAAHERGYCVAYCTDIAKAERFELELALKFLGHRIFKFHDAPELEKAWKHKRIEIRVFVHYSLRYQLHLLPHIKTLRLPGAAFFFFGTKLERGLDPREDWLRVVDSRFWKFATMIFLTPKFIFYHEEVVSMILVYQKAKAGSTKLCVPQGAFDRIEKFVLSGSHDKAMGQRVLQTLYALKDRQDSKDVIELTVDGLISASPSPELEPSDVSRGAPPQIDELLDQFAFYHLEKCEDYRKFVLCHSSNEMVDGMQELFPTIDILDPEAAMKEYGSKQAPPPRPLLQLPPQPATLA